jgi:hypothetical protein
MKRTALPLTFISALLFSAMAEALTANSVEANPVELSDIEVYSPQNKVYYLNEVALGLGIKF